MAGRLHALSPLATLARGYAVLTDTDGAPVTSIDALDPGDRFVARLRDGSIHAQAERTEPLAGEGQE